MKIVKVFEATRVNFLQDEIQEWIDSLEETYDEVKIVSTSQSIGGEYLVITIIAEVDNPGKDV